MISLNTAINEKLSEMRILYYSVFSCSVTSTCIQYRGVTFFFYEYVMVTISSLLFYTHHQFFLDHLLHLHLLRFRIFRAVFLISSVVVSVHSFRFRCRQIVSIDPFEPFH